MLSVFVLSMPPISACRPCARAPLDHRRQQRLADAAAARILAHIDGMFGGQPITRRNPERPIACISQKARPIARRQYRIVPLAGGEPVRHLGFALGILVPRCGAVERGVIENVSDGGKILGPRLVDPKVHGPTIAKGTARTVPFCVLVGNFFPRMAKPLAGEDVR